ncbi:chitinase [Desulfoluna spongiiphila]|uniref:chitinase n=1 Tax=Desulfoluna spongiiphila TaxID=419481 RepID=UPI0012597F1F|nr:chitinase [Desulfoluna spongiiphila]VVS95091.1 consensus disorder prediction [Desulfoluna spongiiphila]
MVTFVASEGTQWYVKMTLTSEEKTRILNVDCSDNVAFDTRSGGSVDRAWSEVAVSGHSLRYAKAGKTFTISANITDGRAFTVCGKTVAGPEPAPGDPEFSHDEGNGDPVEISDEEKGEPLAMHPIESWFTRSVWDELFPHANHQCFEGVTPYSYDSFIKNVRYFPGFASGEEKSQKKEVAAFFGMALQEVGGKSLRDGGPIVLKGLTQTKAKGFSEPAWTDVPSHKWNLAFSSEQGHERSRAYDTGYPLKPNQKYFSGAGILQLSYPVNYARFSQFYYGDKEILLNDSDRVRKDSDLVVASALFYWMAQAGTRPSCHCCFTGNPVNDIDRVCYERITSLGFKKGMAMAIAAVNGIECAIPADYRVGTRVNGYFEYGKAFGLTEDELLRECSVETAEMSGNLHIAGIA